MLFKSHSERDSLARLDNSDKRDKSATKLQQPLKHQKDIIVDEKEIVMEEEKISNLGR
jgi:hypothetical protein